MKKSLFALPLACTFAVCSLAGCPANGPDTNAPIGSPNSNNASNNAVDNNAVSTPTATPSTEPASTPEAVAQSSRSKSAKKTYRVVDETQPGMPAEMVAALKKAKTPPPPDSMKVPDKATVKIATAKGDILVELNGKAAPLHVKSFLYLAGRGFYNGTLFHRYEPGFVIQGGDPLSKIASLRDMAGSGGPGYQVPREFNTLKHNAMVIAAARTADPDSAGSQFYFTLKPATFLDQENSQDGVGYTVFGKVVKGQDVVLKLRAGDAMKSVTVVK